MGFLDGTHGSHQTVLQGGLFHARRRSLSSQHTCRTFCKDTLRNDFIVSRDWNGIVPQPTFQTFVVFGYDSPSLWIIAVLDLLWGKPPAVGGDAVVCWYLRRWLLVLLVHLLLAKNESRPSQNPHLNLMA